MEAATAPRETPAETEIKGLTAKLVAASLAVEHVQKRGRNDFHKYDYVLAEDVAAAATRALLSLGVLSEFECVTADVQPTAKGMLATVTCRLTVTDADSGDQIERTAMGSGSDNPGDKAIYKAMTGARKYAYIHLLGIPIGDDPDAGRGEAKNGSAKPKAPELPKEQVERIKAALKGRNWSQIELVMGSVNADAPKARRSDSLTKAIREMNPAVAESLEKVLEAENEKANG